MKRDGLYSCIFTMTCDTVRQKIDEYNKLFKDKDIFDIGFSIKINDGTRLYEIELSQDDMLVGG